MDKDRSLIGRGSARSERPSGTSRSRLDTCFPSGQRLRESTATGLATGATRASLGRSLSPSAHWSPCDPRATMPSCASASSS